MQTRSTINEIPLKKKTSIDKINVLLIQPNELPKELTLPNTLKARQTMVNGGLVSTSYLSDNKTCLIYNANGKSMQLKPNRIINNSIVYGNILIANEVSGNFRSLSKEQIKNCYDLFNEESIEKVNKRVDDILLLRGILRRKK